MTSMAPRFSFKHKTCTGKLTWKECLKLFQVSKNYPMGKTLLDHTGVERADEISRK